MIVIVIVGTGSSSADRPGFPPLTDHAIDCDRRHVRQRRIRRFFGAVIIGMLVVGIVKGASFAFGDHLFRRYGGPLIERAETLVGTKFPCLSSYLPQGMLQ